jgi:hypothetical protein
MNKERTSSVDEMRTCAPKKPYHPPSLVEYGHIAKLTAGTTGSHTDKGSHAGIHGLG